MKKIIFITFLLAAVSTTAQTNVDSIPAWYGNPPVSTTNFYGVGAGTSISMDVAEQKAVLSANLQLAEQAEPVKVKEIKTTTKSADGRINEEIIQRKIIEATIKGAKMVNKASIQKGDMVTVYVLLEMKKK